MKRARLVAPRGGGGKRWAVRAEGSAARALCGRVGSWRGADGNVRRVMHSSYWFQPWQRRHPALIPQEDAGSSRQSPAIPATSGLKRPAPWLKSPPNPRSARKRYDRPVTPEVAGSSPVAP